jgi:hypothetical protein
VTAAASPHHRFTVWLRAAVVVVKDGATDDGVISRQELHGRPSERDDLAGDRDGVGDQRAQDERYQRRRQRDKKLTVHHLCQHVKASLKP